MRLRREVRSVAGHDGLPRVKSGRFETLSEWLHWQETLNPAGIELGLERVRTVLDRLGHARPPFTIVTVGGTNGKGSSVAMLESILLAAGCRVGSYTSPHLLRYNERIRLQGVEIGDAELCAAFGRVDQARGDTRLTYFEFGTLAAIDIFVREGVDVALLEVGLGGRLDAVNVLDPDVALVTNVGLDHQEWLGKDRESIGREKAGIFRADGLAVCAEADPPQSLLAEARRLGTRLHRAGMEFGFRRNQDHWSWWGGGKRYDSLPFPRLEGDFQLRNGAAVLMVLELLRQRHRVTEAAIRKGLTSVSLPGRLQILPGEVTRLFDVAHNPHAAAALAEALRELPSSGRTLAVVGMLSDKDHAGVFAPLAAEVDAWYLGDLPVPRNAGVQRLRQALARVIPGGEAYLFPTMAAAYRHAMADASQGDRIVVFGSFHTVAEILPETL